MSRTNSRDELLAALDIGTAKVCCLIAHTKESGDLEVKGVGHHRSGGMRNGQVTIMDEIEASVRTTVDAAEQMANEHIDQVFVNVSCGMPQSAKVDVELEISGHQVHDMDVRRILDQGISMYKAEDRELIHCIPTGYSIDGSNGILDPRGMYGDHLGVNIHLITAAIGPSRNLGTVVERCHLEIEERIVSPYAAGLSCLVEDEKELGVTVIDMGAGTTSIAVFMEGQIVFVETIPIGGFHITNDIAKGLSTPMAKAERLKTVYGSVVQTPSDNRELLKVPLVGEDDESTNEIPKSMLIQIIQPRLEETFELVRNQLQTSGFSKLAGRRVVLTGGASQLEGVRDFAELVLDKHIRVGRPKRIKGLPESVSGPAFAVAAGLLRYGAQEHIKTPDYAVIDAAQRRTGLDRIGRWFRKNF